VDSDLSVDDIVARLREREILPAAGEITVQALSGGVSAEVFALSFGDQRLVVKTALARLRVAQDWRSSPKRVVVEADATAFAGAIRPENVAMILDVDREHNVIVMTAAPFEMENWKTQLLAGVISPAVAERLGSALADWHSRSAADPIGSSRFADRTYFYELRISPFFERVSEVHGDLAPAIGRVIERMVARAVCLVHGDFSPKNVLVGVTTFWVLDWEIAHIGDPAFDLAFLVSHLVCKAIHRPEDLALYQGCAEAFLASYLEQSKVAVDQDDLVLQAGCLVLARVDGKSPVDYFDATEREIARALARRTLRGRVRDVAGLFTLG
jgi:aminoglycoside phosphotransferase (APT) family kinase protein